MSLYLPETAVAEMRQRFANEVLKRVTIEDDRAKEFTATLQKIDPRLFMVKAYDEIEPGTPLVPGFYHVLRRNDDAPLTVLPVHDNGAYVEPDSRVFDALARGNMASRRVMSDLEQQEKAVEKAVEREKANKRDDRQAELKDRVNAAVRAQVSLDRSVPWTQTSKARRER